MSVDINLAIRVVMAEKKINQTQLAKKIKMTRAYINYLYNDERIPSFDALGKICVALECKMSYLIGRGEK